MSVCRRVVALTLGLLSLVGATHASRPPDGMGDSALGRPMPGLGGAVRVEEFVADVLSQFRGAHAMREVRVLTPAEVMAMSGYDPLTLQRTSRTWIVLVSTDGNRSVRWLRVLAEESGLTVNSGVFYASRMARCRAFGAHVIALLKPAGSGRNLRAVPAFVGDELLDTVVHEGFPIAAVGR